MKILVASKPLDMQLGRNRQKMQVVQTCNTARQSDIHDYMQVSYVSRKSLVNFAVQANVVDKIESQKYMKETFYWLQTNGCFF